jgi:hypothetical protein
MKIVGKLHDYYDGLMSYGQDESLIFKRESVVVNDKKSEMFKDVKNLLEVDAFKRGFWRDLYSYPSADLVTKKNQMHYANAVFIGFCGKLYFGIHLHSISHLDIVDKFLYTKDEANKFEEQYQYKPRYVDINSSDIRGNWLTGKMGKLSNVFDSVDASEFFIKHRVPYFAVHTKGGQIKEVVLVPELKKYEFQKVKDPYTAYQEISMFLGGVIPRQVPETVEISDKDRIAQHGFDKLSFRHPFKIKKEKK